MIGSSALEAPNFRLFGSQVVWRLCWWGHGLVLPPGRGQPDTPQDRRAMLEALLVVLSRRAGHI